MSPYSKFYAVLFATASAVVSIAVYDAYSNLGDITKMTSTTYEVQPVATAYVIPTPRSVSDAPALKCLARNVYHEARGESRAGQVAVAEVTINRANARFRGNVCKAVYERSVFSWTANRGEAHVSDPVAYRTSLKVAGEVYHHQAPRIVGKSVTNFYNPDVSSPSWARDAEHTLTIGHHRFVRVALSR